MPDRTANKPANRSKHRYRIDPVVAHNRAILAARVRNSPDGYIISLSKATLTDQQKRRLLKLLIPCLTETEEDGNHDAA